MPCKDSFIARSVETSAHAHEFFFPTRSNKQTGNGIRFAAAQDKEVTYII